MKKILVFALASLVAGMAAFAEWAYDGTAKTLTDGNGWVLKVTASGANLTVTGVDASSTGAGALDLSQAISDGMQITAIGGSAFKGNAVITAVTLPDGLTSIGAFAFKSATNLETVTPFLPSALTFLGGGAFADCTKLKGVVHLGESVASFSFGSGSWDSNINYNCPFRNCSSIEGAVLGDAITSIPDACFYNNTSFASVTFGKNITSIGSKAFYNCTPLTSVVLPAGLTSLGGGCFGKCVNLETVTPFLPNNLNSIGLSAFWGCSKLSGTLRIGFNNAVSLPGGSYDKDFENSQQYDQFRGCSSLTTVELGPYITSLSSKMFYGCTSLSSITLGSGITSLGGKAFYNCTSLTEIALPTGLVSVGAGCFGKCSNLETITPFLPENVNFIGYSAFWGCAKLKSKLTIGMNNAVGLDDSANHYDADFENSNQRDQFRGCSSLPEVEFGEYITTLSSKMFQNCTSLTNVIFNGDMPTINASAFNNCANYQMRWLVPSMANWLVFGNDSTKVTPWDGIAEANKAKYTAKFGEEITPKGATTGFQKQFLAFQKAVVLDKLLAFVGEPSALGVDEVTPAYNDVPANVGEVLPLAFSAPEYAEDGDTIWRCAGYRIDTLVDTDWALGTPVAANSGSYDVAEAGTQRLVWLWEKAGYKVSSIDLPDGMSMTASVQPSLQGYYPAGTVVTFTAIGDTFECWCGDIADATIDGNQITVTVNDEIEISPYFATPWVITGSTMTDGYHVFNVSVNEDLKEVSLSSFKENCKAAILDFTKPVVGGYKIVSVPAFYNKAGNPYIVNLKECRFAGTIRSYGKYNYQGITFKMTIPEENDIVGILEGAFSGASGLTGPIVLPKATEVSTFSGTSITSLDLNENLSWVPSVAKNAAIERVVIRYPGDKLSFATYWRQNCSSLKEIVFYGSYNPAGITEGWNSGARTGTNVRYLVPFATDPSWQALASQDAIDAKTFTPWKQCTAAQTNAYWTTFGQNAKKPIGYTTKPGGAWIVELQEPATLLILK